MSTSYPDLPASVVAGTTGRVAGTNAMLNAISDEDSRLLKLEEKWRFIPAASFAVQSGTPALTFVAPTHTPAWLLDDSTQEIIGAMFATPPGWLTAEIFLLWESITNVAGDARVQVRVRPGILNNVTISGAGTTGDGLENAGSTYSVPQYAGTLGAFHSIKLATPAAVFSTTNPGTNNPPALNTLTVRRLGADAADTLVGDLAVSGVWLHRLT